MRKVIVILTALCAVFAFTSMAMALNRVEVKVTSEPISYQAVCDKAGGFSLEFDSNTTLSVGDQITIDLPFTTPSNLVTICKDIDLLISMDAAGTPTLAGATAFTDVAIDPAGVNPTSPLSYSDDPTVADDLVQGAGGGVYFHVYGSVNTQRITVDVLGAANGSLTVGANPEDKLILVILDQKTNAYFALDGIYADPDKNGTYAAATLSDNTLCINVSQFSASTVNANMDSQADKYTFIPSNPQIAHVAAAVGINFYSCGGKLAANPGRTNCGTLAQVNGVDTCTAFDYDDNAALPVPSALGYITATRSGNNRIVIQRNQPFLLTDYQVRLEILVNNDPGDNGVYFSNQVLESAGFDTDVAACAAPITTGDDAGLSNVAFATYRNAAGGSATPEAPHAADCTVANAGRAVYAETAATAFGALGLAGGATNDFLLLDIPAFNYDLPTISEDDVVTVRVTLIKAPCGVIFTGVKTVATLCADTPPVVPQASRTIVFPYFTAAANDNWWDGIVITNLDGSEGHFTALVYEQDGDVGAFTGTIDANSLYQSTLQTAMAGADQVDGSGTLGDSLCYMIVCVDFTADGFGFMGSLSTNTLMANESMGYIPRVDYINGSQDNITFCSTLGITAGDLP